MGERGFYAVPTGVNGGSELLIHRLLKGEALGYIFSVEVGGVESCFVELPVHGRHRAVSTSRA